MGCVLPTTFPALAAVGLWLIAVPVRCFAQQVSARAGSSGGQTPSVSPASRPLRIDDAFAEQDIDDNSIVFAPDGQGIALVIGRPQNTLPKPMQSSLVRLQVRNDVWIQEGLARPLRNLTQGQEDASGWWDPQWAPDGQRLAMLSTRGDSITLWVWERSTGRLRQVSPHAVRLEESHKRTYHWVDARRVMYLAPAVSGHASSKPLSEIGQVVAYAKAAWTRAQQGEATASVVRSTAFISDTARLILLDIVSGAVRALGMTAHNRSAFTGRNAYYPQSSGTWWPSPSGNAVAFVKAGPTSYNTASRVRMGSPRNLELRDLEGQLIALDRSLPENVQTTSIQWSPDGQELAFFANGTGPVNPVLLYGLAAAEVFSDSISSLENPARLYRAHLVRRTLREVDTGEMDMGQLSAPQFTWTDAGELVFHAPRRRWGYTTWPPASRGAPWGFSAENAVAVGSAAPREWFALSADGRMTIPAPGATNPPAGSRQANEAAERRRVEQLVSAPAPGARMVAFTTKPLSAVYLREDRRGTVLWRSYAEAQRTDVLLTANQFREGIVQGGCRLFDYTSLNRDQLKGLLCVPVGYTPSRRYPMVVEVYPGLPVRGALDPDGRLRDVYGAAGFVYMRPSMLPRNNLPGLGTEEGWSLLMFPQVTLPAVDRVVELGIADPDRVFITGGSGGGWGTMALITQTTRFRAAMAASSGSGGLFDAGGALTRSIVTRYSDNPSDMVSPQHSWHLRPTDVPWWRDGDRYRRNDALSYVDRVQTPLLLLHGDLDAVQIETSEDFFNALVSMRKPAQLVRYWGTGHGDWSPANMRDRWQRTLAWFDDWGDISRDAAGEMVFQGERVRSRAGQPALPPEAYAKFPIFGPGGEAGHREWAEQQAKRRGGAAPPSRTR